MFVKKSLILPEIMKTGTVIRYIVACLVAVGALCAWGLGMAVMQDTFIPGWVPWVVALVPAVVLLPVFVTRWPALTGIENRWVGALCHLVVFGGLFFILFLGSNYMFARESTAVSETASVVEKHRREHTRYRRVSRRSYVPSGHYHTWHLVLELDDGRRHEQSVSAVVYNRTRVGARRKIPLQRGLFGFTVVKKLPHDE